MKKAKLIESEIRKKSKLKNFITPDYEKYCVSNIPNTVLSILGVKNKKNKIPKKDIEKQTKGIKKVVILLIDSLGYNHFVKFIRKNKNSFFNDMVKKGDFFPLTSTFPSITPVALSTYSTGLSPQEHGILASSFYHEKIKQVISVLHFSVVGSLWPLNLMDMGIKPRDLLKSKTVFERLKKAGIKSFIINYEEFIGSDFNKMLYRGSKEVSYKNYKDAFKKLNNILKKDKKLFVFCYLFQIDDLLHDVWSESLLFNELNKISKIFKTFIKNLDKKISQETLFIIASDHGQVKLSKRKMVFLEDHPKIIKNILVEPMGGIRSVFLKTKRNKKKEVEKYLKSKFRGKALVLDSKEIERKRLSGLKKMTKKNYERIGDLAILPYENYVFIPPLKEDQKFMAGQHGGLTKEEMLVPFVCIKASNIKS